jgi:hypothetical protein
LWRTRRNSVCLPPGAYIGREEYTPYVDGKLFRSRYLGICGAVYRTPDSIRADGFDYLLVASQERFDVAPQRYLSERAGARALRQEFPVVARFVPDAKQRGQAVTVLKVTSRNQAGTGGDR